RKRFGQNFLKDEGVIQAIARAISADTEDHIVEIGPGQGALTESLVTSGCTLDAIELDRDLTTGLLAAFSIHPQFTLHTGDALKFDYGALRKDDRPLRVVGNLPYNISTPLLFRLFEHLDDIEDMHFMLQLEVVNRLTATHSTSDYGRLSIMSQIYCDSQNMFSVPPEAFTPRPKVMSAIVKLTPHHNSAENVNMERLQTLLTKTFSMRRKTIRNALKGFITAQGLEEIGLDPMLRPENLDLKDYLNILSHFESKASTAT
ncbi:MAG: 16S rRNA (adenine(1518)-N(6)/adenine(1519)-N(6))-dimethyltransferase RsmA, partial [Pseudomonadales bacterium]|nr:16S rRNA (adenine(1518)-N(6)/adenine(1519)-N(6))-dimethyltransferase RsmA [Pseudomonadales bacterium]